MIEIKPYNPSLEEAHIAFASKYWTKSRRLTPEYIYWKFRGVQNQELKSFILAIENDIIVGQLGIIPVSINFKNKSYTSQWICDLMVDSEYRGKGVAKQLYEFAHKQKEVTLSSDPSPAALKSMLKSGYKPLTGNFKYFFSTTIGGILKFKNINHKILNIIPNFFVYLFLILDKINKSIFYSIDNIEFQKYNNPIDREEFVSVIHDSEFINWRYNKFENYYDGIETFKNCKNETFSGYYSATTFFITDFNLNNRLSFFKIISQILKTYKDKKIEYIRFYNNDVKFSNWLLFFGFIKFRRREEIIFFTENDELNKSMINKKFYYTYSDCDENI